MRGTFLNPPFRSFSSFAGAILALTFGFFTSVACASEAKWDYIIMCDTDLGTGQEVGYLTLHVDIPISNTTTAVATAPVTTASVKAVSAIASSKAIAPAAVAAIVPAVGTHKEQTVLGALSGEGDFDAALSVVATEAAALKANLPGLADFLLARRSGDSEGFKQWTLNARPLQLLASKDAATGASVISYRRLMAELRVQIKLGPDYRQVMADLQSPKLSVFQAAVDKVVLATNKASNGGIDYGDYAVQVLNSLKNRKAPVPYTQATMAAGTTNSAQ
jgi:hypothetical protein